jgi:hypothetical protein
MTNGGPINLASSLLEIPYYYHVVVMKAKGIFPIEFAGSQNGKHLPIKTPKKSPSTTNLI